jgi:hypothetical protein
MKFGADAKTRLCCLDEDVPPFFFFVKRGDAARARLLDALDMLQLIAGKRVFALGHVFWGKKYMDSVDSGSCIVCRPTREEKKRRPHC